MISALISLSGHQSLPNLGIGTNRIDIPWTGWDGMKDRMKARAVITQEHLNVNNRP